MSSGNVPKKHEHILADCIALLVGFSVAGLWHEARLLASGLATYMYIYVDRDTGIIAYPDNNILQQ